MKVFETIEELKSFIKGKKNISLVPTMGALHKGHLKLIKEARKRGGITIVSIFINKIQFDDIDDFNSYPKTLIKDEKLLESAGVDVLFMPFHDEMYGESFSTYVTENRISKGLCGGFRKGHFNGVLTVVLKLFNITNCKVAFFGEKDLQQLFVIKKMVSDLNLDVEIIPVETEREKSGLALSSRNKNLSKDGKKLASKIYKNLMLAKEMVGSSFKSIEDITARGLANDGIEKIEYVKIRKFEDSYYLLVSVYIDGVRLIDNVKINK